VAAGLPPVLPGYPPRDDASANSHDGPRALDDEDEEGRNIRRIPRIRRLIAPRRRLRKESTLPDDDAGDSRTATETADGPDDGHRSHPRRSLSRSKGCNCSDCIPRWAETSDRP